MNKHGEEGSGWGFEQIIAIVLVLLVIGGVLLFFYKNDINAYLRNLFPTYQGNNQSSDEVVAGADEAIANICPVKVAEVYPGSTNKQDSYFKINVSNKWISSQIYYGTQNKDGTYDLRIADSAWSVYIFTTSLRVYNRDTIIGKIDSNKNVVVDANFLNDVKLQIVKYTSAEDYVNADKFIELQDELSAIQGSMSKGGGIFCKNK